MFGVSVEFYHVFSKFDPKIKVVWTEAGIHVLREPWHLCCHWDAPSFLVTWIFHHVLKDADMDEMWWTWQYDEIWWNMDEIWWYRIWMFQNFRSEFWMSHFFPPQGLYQLCNRGAPLPGHAGHTLAGMIRCFQFPGLLQKFETKCCQPSHKATAWCLEDLEEQTEWLISGIVDGLWMSP